MTTSRYPWLRRRSTLILMGLVLLVLVLSAPGSLREAFERGDIYVFSSAFFEDIPRRLTGPGRFRFILQPLIATILGIRGGLEDARTGRPPFLYAVLFKSELRGELVRSGLASVVNLVLMGILMDAVFQWVLFGVSYPGAALVVGPVLILAPYSISRALSNRFARLRKENQKNARSPKTLHDPDNIEEDPACFVPGGTGATGPADRAGLG